MALLLVQKKKIRDDEGLRSIWSNFSVSDYRCFFVFSEPQKYCKLSLEQWFVCVYACNSI